MSKDLGKPLTTDELFEMDGMPVWAVDNNGMEAWVLIHLWDDAEKPLTFDFCGYDSESGEWDGIDYGREDNGNGWLAYKKPLYA